MRTGFAGRNFRSAGLLLLATAVTTGCSPALYGLGRGPGMPYPPPGLHAHARPFIEQIPTGRWDNVMRLPHGSTIDVLTTNGAASVGWFVGADIDSVRVTINGAGLRIARNEIVRVDLVDLAGSEVGAVTRKTARGALLGAGVAVLIAGVIGGEAWPPPGQALRGGAAIGGISAGQAEYWRREGRPIYLTPLTFVPPPNTHYR